MRNVRLGSDGGNDCIGVVSFVPPTRRSSDDDDDDDDDYDG